MKDEDFVVCGYIPKGNHMTSLVLGQYNGGQLICRGHVTLGVGGENFRRIKALPHSSTPYCQYTEDNHVIWVEPSLVCTVKYMMKTENGNMRQPVLKGLRYDKEPAECRCDEL